MVNQETSRLSSAKLHRHQRVQKILTNRSYKKSISSSSDTSSLTSSDDDHSTSSSFSSDIFVSKQQQRKLRNRKSAESSRLKKRQDTEAFKTKVTKLEYENSILRSLLLQKHPDILHQLQILQDQSPAVPPTVHPSAMILGVSTLPSSAAGAGATTAGAGACNSNEFAIQP